jgi:RNA recognition motif-containing protein
MTNIFVGNLKYDVTEDEVREVFAQHGEIQSVAIIKDRQTGQSKGFGFVEMPNAAAP